MPRPVDVSPGVQAFATRTPTLPPATHTNSYALGAREVLLVEPATPYEAERREWVEWARGLESSGRTLVGILLTHHHPDHAGGAEFFARELGLPLLAHELTQARLPHLPVTRRVAEGDRLVLAGPQDQAWSVLFTPGHAPGHVCLHEPSLDALIVGDMVATEGTILVDTTDGDMRIYLEQLGRLAALDAASALPAHGAPIQTPRHLFEYYIRHRLKRETKVLEAVRAATTPRTVAELVPVAYEDTPPSVWPIAALSLAAHLVKLQSEGQVASDGERYRALPPP